MGFFLFKTGSNIVPPGEPACPRLFLGFDFLRDFNKLSKEAYLKMEVKINFGDVGGNLLVSPGGEATIIREDSDIPVCLRELQDKRIESLDVRFANGLSIVIAHDGWQISIEEDVWDSKALVVKRYRNSEGKTEVQYLTKTGEWLPKQSGKKLSSDALRMSIFTSKRE